MEEGRQMQHIFDSNIVLFIFPEKYVYQQYIYLLQL